MPSRIQQEQLSQTPTAEVPSILCHLCQHRPHKHVHLRCPGPGLRQNMTHLSPRNTGSCCPDGICSHCHTAIPRDSPPHMRAIASARARRLLTYTFASNISLFSLLLIPTNLGTVLNFSKQISWQMSRKIRFAIISASRQTAHTSLIFASRHSQNKFCLCSRLLRYLHIKNSSSHICKISLP